MNCADMEGVEKRIANLLVTNAELTQQVETPSNKSVIKAEFEATTANTIKNLMK